MAYNRQANPWGGSSSELGWRGFADGSKHGNPAALAPPSSDPYTKLAIKAITDIGGAAWDEYTAPVNAGQSMWGDELKGFDTAIADQVTDETTKLRRNKNAIELAAAERAKADFIRSHPNAGKSIWNRPEWTENVPDFLMPGGSRYEVPKGAINSRQANTYRSNWKADPKFVPTYAPSQETKTVVTPEPAPANSSTIPGDVITSKDPNETYAHTTLANASKRRNLKSQLQSSWDKVTDGSFTPEFLLSAKDREAENKMDEITYWLGGQGNIGISGSKANAYFSKYPEQYAEFDKNPIEWYYSKGPGKNSKKDYAKYSLFGN